MTRPGLLYISYTGMLDPLGQSQVLAYLKPLAEDRPVHLISFEHPDRVAEPGGVEAIGRQCRAAGIVWHPRTRLARFGPLGTAYALLIATLLALVLVRREKLSLVHCRSYLAAAMGLVVKRLTGARFVFDMRGFWPDERADAGIWRRGGLRYRGAKWLERWLLNGADHIVSLTRAGAADLAARDAEIKALVTVIPTCTDLTRFRPAPRPDGPFTLGYVGSTGSWYLFDAVADAVTRLFQQEATARFRIVTQSAHDTVRARLAAAGVDLNRVDLRAVPHGQVADEIAQMHAGVFFIAPVASKRASCPTRMGEFLACGRPVLANGGVGDVAEDLAATGTGITLSLSKQAAPCPEVMDRALADLRHLAQSPGIADRCRRAAEDRFALDQGVAAYRAIYRGLCAGQEPALPRPVKRAWSAS